MCNLFVFCTNNNLYFIYHLQGKLVLSNTEDGTDHVFHLCGKPQKPLALDHVVIRCEAKKG